MLLAVHYRVMEHLGSLESTQEARLTLGYGLEQLLRFFRALQTSFVLHNSIVHAKHEPIVNYVTGILHTARISTVKVIVSVMNE